MGSHDNPVGGISHGEQIRQVSSVSQETHQSNPKKDKENITTEIGKKALEEQRNESQTVSASSVFSRTWRHIESFFSSVGKYIHTIFRSIFPGKKEEKNHNPLVVPQNVISQNKAVSDADLGIKTNTVDEGGGSEQTKNQEDIILVKNTVHPPESIDPAQEVIASKKEKTVIDIIPKGLPNKGINACYRNASNQAIFNSPALRKLLKTPLAKLPEEPMQDYVAREKIRVALRELCEALDSKKSATDIEKAEANLRKEIFHSGLHPEFDPNSWNIQQDAPTYIDFILNTILNYQIEAATTKSAKSDGKADSNTETESISPCIHLFMNNSGKQNLQEILNKAFSPINDEAAWREFASHTNETKLIGAPQNTLIFQLKRGQTSDLWNVNVANLDDDMVKSCFGYSPEENVDPQRMRALRSGLQKYIFDSGANIIQDPVEIPLGGKLNLSLAYGKEGEELNYQINSFIRLYARTGSYGHYVSYVKKEEQWYRCDDATITSVSEQDAMKEMSLAYVYMLERSPKRDERNASGANDI